MSADPIMSVVSATPRRPRPLVVVAEDGTDERTMLGLMLSHRGFEVVLTANGREAFNAVLAHGPNAVVSDMNMPHLDGLGFCQAVRALPAESRLPVILWSGVEATEPRLLAAIALGGVEFLSKSLPLAALNVVLRRLLHLTEVDSAS